MGEILMHLSREIIRKFGGPISRPTGDSRALFVDRETVGPNMLSITVCVYDPDRRPIVDDFWIRSAIHRPHMDFLAERAYECEDHSKKRSDWSVDNIPFNSIVVQRHDETAQATEFA
jgi:hypothetical protein